MAQDSSTDIPNVAEPTGRWWRICLGVVLAPLTVYRTGNRLVMRLYRWVLSWADSRFGTPALFSLSFAESSFFPIPPDVLQIALSIAKPARSFFYATVSGVGSVLGGVAGWYVGYALWGLLGDFFYAYVPGVTPENFALVQGHYNDNAMLAILASAFTPIPFKVFTIAAGVFDVRIWVLVVASTVGRFGRFYLVAGCIYLFGPSIKALLERYFDWAALLLFALLIGGFVAIKYLF